MKHSLKFFNWSLAKLLATEPDALKRARISIIFAVIILSFLKVIVAIPAVVTNDQGFQLVRVLVFLVVMLTLLKYLLIDRRYAIRIGVIIIWFGMFLTWSNVFITAQTINIATIQVVVTIILSSFYILTWRWALFYSCLSVIPVIILLIVGEESNIINIAPDVLASPAYELIVMLNFLTIIIAHFLYYQALNKNVQEKELLNAKLKEAVKEANRAVQSKADFLSTMSHELRTPLNSVIGMTQLLLESPYSPEQSENLKIMNFSAMNLQMLINDILDFNKMESDKLKLENINVNLYSLASDICLGMRFLAEEKGLQLIFEIDDRIKNDLVITDPTRLTQILHNLLGNAIKFTPSGYVSLILRIVAEQPDSLTVGFSVRDTGIGISTGQQGLIFEAFTQASSSTTRNFGGTGLGLTIVKSLLKLFDSDIRLTSEVGMGSDFSFDISFHTAGAVEEVAEAGQPTVYNLERLNVLVVEDNPINSLLIKKIFVNWNTEPEFASDGYEALEKINTGIFDVILMDIHMPKLDGYETSRLIRAMDGPAAAVHIIALTASVSNDLHAKITAAGMNDYINKPFNSHDLYRKLFDVLRSVRQAPIEILPGTIEVPQSGTSPATYY